MSTDQNNDNDARSSSAVAESCAQAEEGEPNYTPGPWLLATSNSYRRFVNERMSPVVTPTTQSVDGHPDLIVDEADANMIAAAPDLFQAAKQAEEALHHMMSASGMEPHEHDCYTDLKAAIAKAEGEA